MAEWSAESYGRVNEMQQWLAARATSGLVLAGDEHVLDVGCGDGRVTETIVARLPRGLLVGVDQSPSMVEAARRRLDGAGDVRFEVGDAASLPYAGGFDVVVSFSALHWVRRWEAALDGVRTALRPGGRALLVFVCDGERRSVEDVAMQTCASPRWRPYFRGFEAPYVHVEPDAYAAAAAATGFRVDEARVDDLEWDFGSREVLAAWCTAGFVAWTSRLAADAAAPFVADVLDAYADVAGSAQQVRFLQLRVALTVAQRA